MSHTKPMFAQVAKIMLASLLVLSFIGCDLNSSTVRFYNRANDPFQLYIDGTPSGIIPANKFMNLSVEAGYHVFKVVQTEGYLAFPTEYTKNVTIEAGKSLEWSWGNYLMPSN
jgi:hypothetical protein